MEQKVCSLTIRGETKQYPLDTTFQQIADEYQKQFENKIVLVKFQNDLKELSQSVLRDGSLEFVTADQKPGKDTYRRSLTLLMETAAWKLYPNPGASGAASMVRGIIVNFVTRMPFVCLTGRCFPL